MAGTGTAHLRDGALLAAEDLVVEFRAGRAGTVQAVSGISLDVLPGETLGVVGESGCGKSTTGQAIVQLVKRSSGTVRFDGVDMDAMNERERKQSRSKLQMIFQDPASSLNPWRRVIDIVSEPLRIWHIGDADEQRRRGRAALEQVGLDPDTVGERRPPQLSGGQCQRVAIARALMLEPKLIVCDEPVSSLDVSVQAQVINLLEDMKLQYGLSLIFIAHDLAAVRAVSDRIVVMYLGKVCEVAPSATMYERPRHPYSQLLIDAIPRIDAGLVEPTPPTSPAEVPSPLDPPSGCRFRTRCPRAQVRCAEEEPRMEPLDDHFVACHYPLDAPGPDSAVREP